MSESELIKRLREVIGESLQRKFLVIFADLMAVDGEGNGEVDVQSITPDNNNVSAAVAVNADANNAQPTAGVEDSEVIEVVQPKANGILEVRNEQIEYALASDLECCPKLTRSGNTTIEVHSRKQARQENCNRALQCALLWRYADPHLKSAERRRMAKATCQLVACDHPLSHNMLPTWEAKLKSAFDTGEASEDATTPQHAGSNKHASKTEQRHPGYVRELF